ncbi:MAG: hypothetical protein JST00_26180 [Deltaproteobacteria bacterium]|nr:hypothetical protein [Deltaproteobacteria bacterium]
MKASARLLGLGLAAVVAATVGIGACGGDGDPQPTADAGVTTSKRIGPGGGTVTADGVTLEIPPGALTSEVEIGIKPVSNPKLPDQVSLVGTAYELSPAGIEFAKPVKLVLPLPAGTPAKETVLIRLPTGGAEWLPVGAPDEGATSVTGFTRGFSTFAAVKMLFAQAGCFAPTSCDLSCDYAALTCKGSCKSRGLRIAAGASCELTPQGIISCSCDPGNTGLSPRYPGPFTIGFLEGLMKPQLLLFGVASHCGWPCDGPSDAGTDASTDGGPVGSCGAGGPRTPTVAYDTGAVTSVNVSSVRAGRVYFTSFASPTTTVASVATDGTGFVSYATVAQPLSVRAVDATATHVVWNEGSFGQAGGVVRRYPLPAGPAEDLVTDVLSPWAIWADSEVFFSELSNAPGSGGVRSTTAGPHVATGVDRIQADATHAFFNATQPSALYRLPRDLSGAATPIFSGSEVGPAGEAVRSFVVDDTNAYILANNGNLALRVRRRAKDGTGAIVDVTESLAHNGFTLTSDANCLYFCTNGKGPGNTDKLFGVSKTGSNQKPNVMIADFPSCGNLAADATHLYYGANGKVMKVAK